MTPFIDAALKRLNKSILKHYTKEDEFHISHEEAERTKDRVAALALLQSAFNSDVRDIVRAALQDNQAAITKAEDLTRKILETYFYRLGEEFVQMVAADREIPLHPDILKGLVLELSPKGMATDNITWEDFIYFSVKTLITSPSSETTELFKVWSKAYTLLAFLSEVPDVQRATKKLFEFGNFWFDTTVLLPLFAERAFPDDLRPFSDLVKQLARTGQKLWVTYGVIHEIERHLNLCKAYLRTPNWEGRIPYVYQRYALSGRAPEHFNAWIEQFLGDHRPLDDLADFLRENAGIEVITPLEQNAIPISVVNEVRRYWHAVQVGRRRGPEGVGIHASRLAEHDIENYVSVLAQRHIEPGKSNCGYTSWLITLDGAAWRLLDEVNSETAEFIKHRPTISLDFLLRYLSFCPRRDQIDASESGYARVFTLTTYESIPAELIAVAQQVRKSCFGLTERLVQRRIRDEFDKQRMRAGSIQTAGLDGLDNALAEIF